jgi:hypothetical protein
MDLQRNGIPYVANFPVSQPVVTVPPIAEAIMPTLSRSGKPRGYWQISQSAADKLNFVYPTDGTDEVHELLPAQRKIVPVNHLCPTFYAKHK